MERFNGAVQNFTAKTGDAFNASEVAYRQISFAIDKQAYLLSYLDTFRLISYFFIGVFPVIFLVRSAKKKSEVSNDEAAKAAMDAAH
jgi:DHA2 family multidrug resistance protein